MAGAVLFKGYPQSNGGKIQSQIALPGPTSYTTAGFTVQAQQFAMKGIEFVNGCISTDGLFEASAVAPSKTVPKSSIKIFVWVTATGVQVGNGVDLSGSTFVFQAQGI